MKLYMLVAREPFYGCMRKFYRGVRQLVVVEDNKIYVVENDKVDTRNYIFDNGASFYQLEEIDKTLEQYLEETTRF